MSEAAESLGQAAARIRQICPIAGDQATDHECAERRDLIDLTLARRGVATGERTWFTAQLVTGRIVGVWACSSEEAELDLSVWWGADCAWVRADADLRVREEYLHPGVHSRDAVFAVQPPRTPRDRFAPAASLLTELPITEHAEPGWRR